SVPGSHPFSTTPAGEESVCNFCPGFCNFRPSPGLPVGLSTCGALCYGPARLADGLLPARKRGGVLPSDDPPRTHLTRPHPDRLSRMTLRPCPPGGEERIPMRPGTVALFALALPTVLWLVLLPSRCGAGPLGPAGCRPPGGVATVVGTP